MRQYVLKLRESKLGKVLISKINKNILIIFKLFLKKKGGKPIKLMN